MYSNNVFLCVKILANRLFDLIIVMIAFNDLHTRTNFFCNRENIGYFVVRNEKLGLVIWFGRAQFYSFI